MDIQPRVSVFIPIRGVENDLQQSLSPLPSRVLAEFEIICPDGQSAQDNSNQIRVEYHQLEQDKSELFASLEMFECRCRQADVVSILRGLCQKWGILEQNRGILAALERRLMDECIQVWYSDVLPRDREEAAAYLFKAWDSKLLVSALAKKYWDAPEEVARRIGRIRETPLNQKQVRTIGIHNYHMGIGGTERVISILAPTYREMGYQVVVVTNDPPTGNDFPLETSIPREVLSETWRTNRDTVAARLDKWDALLKKYSFELVIYHPWTSPLAVWDVLFLKLNHVSVVFQTHSIFSFLLAEGKRDFSPLTDKLILGDGITVLSESDKVFWDCFHPNVYHIPNPISPALMQAQLSQGRQDIIVWVGRFSEEKRPLDAILIMEYVVRRHPDAMLYMIGGGKDAVMVQCKEAVHEKGIENNVVFLGFQKNVDQYLANASVNVITSVYEGYSMALLEAMAHGVPTVMYEMQYLELYREDYGVVGVEASNYRQAAVEIVRLLEERTYWEHASGAAKAGFSETAHYDYCAAWKKLIKGEISPSKIAGPEQVMMQAVVDHYLVGWEKNQPIQPVQNSPAHVKENALLRLIKKARGGIQCYRENGMKYTLYRIKEKLQSKFCKS